MKKLLLPVLYIFSSYVFSQTVTEETLPISYDVSQKKLLQSAIVEPPPIIITPGEPGGGVFLPVEEAVPTINSEMEVNNSGALVYTVPIEVLPGINNFQPNLALSYNSQSGNGQAGWGWNLIGLSVITQGGTSKEIEGITRGPQFTDSDPLYLDGQRLIKTGTNTYETRLYSKVQILKGTDGNYSFIVKYPDGKIGKYKQLGYGQHYISTFIDPLGTEIHYQYTTSGNIPFLSSISYGGTSAGNDTYKIEFTYKPRKYTVRSWKNGQQYINDKILSLVTVSSTYNGIYRKYSFKYEDLTSQNEKLVTVEVENGQGEKLKPLNFTYGNSQKAEINFKNYKGNSGLPYNTESLGSVATGDFLNQGKPFPIYSVKTKDGYKIFNSGKNNSIPLSADDDTQLFAGKTLLQDGSIPENEQLIAINTEFISDGSFNPGLPSNPNPNPRGYEFYQESIDEGTILGGIEVKNMVARSFTPPASLPRITLYTPKVKVNLSVFDPLTNQTRTVYFYAKGNYFGNVEEKCKKDTYSLMCEEFPMSQQLGEKNQISKDLGKRRIIVGDLNNDGLTDILIQNKPTSCSRQMSGATKNYDKNGNPIGLSYNTQCFERESTFYFIEIGKNTANGEITPQVFTSEVNHLGTLIEFDGDGIPELLFLAQDQYDYEPYHNTLSNTRILPLITVLKINTQEKSIKKVPLTNDGNLLSSNDYKDPVFYGDFNGDGLTDFMIPRKIFELTGNASAGQVKDQINSAQLVWDLYTNTGKEFQRKEMDLTPQKVAYIKPTQKHNIKKSSVWSKIWSGKPDEYQSTEYGTSFIIPTDFDNDGKTDLISIRKFTKFKMDSQYLDKLGSLENIQTSDPGANIITFHKAVTDNNGNTSFVKLETEIPLKDIKMSSLSLIMGNSDFNQLNTYKSGVTIYDPITKTNTDIDVNNDNFTETYLRQVDNGSGVVQTVEYRPMVKNLSTTKDRVYTTVASGLKYPYYTHQNQGTQYLAYKVNTLFDGKALTTEYRYQNGIQQLEGKGFLGFQKTYISDTYESELVDGSYYKKDIFGSPVFWKTNTFDPTYDNSLIRTTYGSLDDKTFFTESTTTYQKYDKGNFRYLILSTTEKNKDYLKKVNSQKTYTYDPATLYLTEAYTTVDDGFSTSNRETYSYKPDFTNGEHTFSGKIEKTETTQSRSRATFTTKEEITYNNSGQAIQSKKYGNNTDAITTTYAYDNYGNTLTETVSAPGLSSLTTKYEYDTTHRFAVKVTSPDGQSATKNINTLGQVLSETSELGLITTYTYDNWNNLKTTTDYLGIKTIISKTALENGKYQVITQAEGKALQIAIFDKFDRKIQTRTLVMGKWLYADTQYDIFGKVVKTSEPYYEGETPLWNITEYDYLNRPVKQTLYTGKIVTTCYEGLKVTVQDGHKKTSRTLDASGHTIEHNDSGGKIKYTYFPNGALKEANYDGIAIKNEQDGWGNKTKTIDPSAGTYQYSYDNYGKMLKETTPKGYTTFTYDSYGKLLTEVSEGDGVSISKVYTYDPTTKLPVKISGYSNGKSFTYETYYDQYFRIKGKKETTPYLVSESGTTFDAYGRADISTLKTTVTDIGYTTTSKVRNEYNIYSELIRQWDADTNTLIQEIQSINSHGQITQAKYGNGYSLTNTYNNLFYLQNTTHKTASQTAVNIDYDYDVLKGTLKSRNNKNFNKNESFEYDELDRLLKERINAVLQNEYTYDKRGRMTYNSNVGAYNYADTNYQLNKITFNTPGTQLKQNRGFHEVSYNSFKSPTEIYLPNKDRISFEYGILKNRSAMYYGNTDTNISSKPNRRYYTSDGSVEVTKTGNNYKVVTYINGDGYSATYIKIEQLTGSTLSSSKKYFVHRDNQQSIIALTDAQGGVIAEQRYFDAWGNLAEVKDFTGKTIEPSLLLTSYTLLLDRGYTGHEHLLSVGLINMNARLYDPALRRFMSPDNFVQEPYNTQNYNRYGYVLNNPLLYTDPSGEEFFSLTTLIIGVAIAITTNGINNAINGNPFWYGIGKSAVIGAATSVISMGIGTAAQSWFTNTVSRAAFQAGMHGVTGGVMNSIEGENFISGFASGAVSSIISSGIEALGTNYAGGIGENGNYGKNAFGNSGGFKAVMIASGGLSGGISSSIAGGNFWSGVRQGLITSWLNHGMNHLADKWLTAEMDIKQVHQKEGMDCVLASAEMMADYLDMDIKDKIKSLRNRYGEKGFRSTVLDSVLDYLGFDVKFFQNSDGGQYNKGGIDTSQTANAVKFIVESILADHPVMLGYNASDMQSGDGHASVVSKIKYTEDFSKFKIIVKDPAKGGREIYSFRPAHDMGETVYGIYSVKKR